MCRSCLEERLNPPDKARPAWLGALRQLALAGFGLVLASCVFFLVGRILLRIPSQFHSGIFFE